LINDLNVIRRLALQFEFIIVEQTSQYIIIEEPGTGSQCKCYTLQDFINWNKEIFSV
jgi:hypothetical protein